MTTEGPITNRELYEVWRDTEKQLGGLALQVATLVAEWRGVGERLDSGSERMRDFEARLRVLEQWRWRSAGAASLCGLLSGGAVAALITWALSHH